ncbi:MAG: site-specific integrase [Treponema sp.]|nr:site-specific integrase [Treponema sp.]
MSELAEAIAQVRGQQQQDIASMRFYIISNFPDTIKAMRKIDFEYTRPKRRKGFNLVKRESKQYGFLYYVRYSHNGRKLPTKFNTHTNNLEAAEQFARDNKDCLIERYLARKDGRMFTTLENFYEANPALSHLSENCKMENAVVIKKKFIPFLRQERIASFDQIKAVTLYKFQDHLLAGGIKPQTVNSNLCAVKRVFSELARKGMIPENPGDHIRGIPVHREDRKMRGCYELERVQKVFNRKWKDEESYLLCLLIYTTGMRNSEIRRLRMDDIEKISGCRFINIKMSKTQSGVRLIPLHETVYRKLEVWAARNKNNSLLFDHPTAASFCRANEELARQLKAGGEELEREHITFYSGRHFWKTLMNAEGLGDDIEEFFMGHKVSGNVAKLYNHRDKQGKQLMVKKAKQVFSILDRRLFKTKP